MEYLLLLMIHQERGTRTSGQYLHLLSLHFLEILQYSFPPSLLPSAILEKQNLFPHAAISPRGIHIWKRKISILIFYSIPFYFILFYSILFYSTLHYSILFNSIQFNSILFYSILFCSILCYTILLYPIQSSILPYSVLFYFSSCTLSALIKFSSPPSGWQPAVSMVCNTVSAAVADG